MGAYASRTLAADAAVDEVIVADIDEASALAVVEDTGSKTTALRLDIYDDEALRTALKGVDVVLGTAGPFYRHGRHVLEAAIEAGIDYLDICDDWEPTLQMLELDERARDAGVTAVIGMGASPGISNLLAALAMNECDQVDRVFTAWRAGAGVPRRSPENPEPKAAANVVHWVHNVSDPIKVWRDGKLVEAWALEELPLSYPGRGVEPAWTCGHPEPLTIPRAQRGVRESLNLMTSRRGMMDALIRIADRVRSGELDVSVASDKLLLEPDMFGSAAGPAPTFPDLFAVVEGIKDGEPISVGARPLAIPDRDMGEYTGIPLAVATLMLLGDQVDNPGVNGPEVAVDPDRFFERLAKFAPGSPSEGPYVEVLTEPIREPRPV